MARLHPKVSAWEQDVRIDMLSTGIKTPVGVNVSGPDIKVLARVATNIEQTLKQ